MKIDQNGTIYVLCPAFYKTGGTELLHQLVCELNKNNINAVITYYWTRNDDKSKNINPEFRKYVNIYIRIDEIVDEKENIIVFPETRVKFIKNYKNAKRIIWWMSVDNYMSDCFYSFSDCVKKNGIGSSIVRLIKRTLNTDKLVKYADYNLCQSHYAIDFCTKLNASNIFYLSDYISDEYTLEWSTKDRNNIVLYNPKKGWNFTEKIIKKAKNIKFVPLINMSSEEVRATLMSSKVYIDFGNHPGKDRFPREAAFSGCCIITDKKGSAAFYDDVPIKEEYKFNDDDSNIDSIIKKIEYCLFDYEIAFKDFEDYRNFISNEKMLFAEDVKSIFAEKIYDKK